MAQFPLEVHSRGMTFVTNLLRDAGHEVIVLGNAQPEAITRAASDEAVDIIGISTYCGGLKGQFPRMWDRCPSNIRIMVGGIVSAEQRHWLEEMPLGVGVFPSGTDPQKILEYVNSL